MARNASRRKPRKPKAPYSNGASPPNSSGRAGIHSLKAANDSLVALPGTELGVSGLRMVGGQSGNEFDPFLRGIRGIRTYEEMRHNDPVIGAVLRAVELVCRGVTWRAQPNGMAEKLTGQPANEEAIGEMSAFVDSCMDDMAHTWADFISEALTIVPFGWAYHEIIYKRRSGPTADPRSKWEDGKIGWRKVPLRGQETLQKWAIDEHGGILGMHQGGNAVLGKSVFIPIEKAILFRTTREKNNPEGVSWLRNAVRPYTAKKNIEDVESIGIERDLTGLPWMQLPEDAKEEDFATARDIVERIKTDDQMGLVTQNFGPELHENWQFQLLGSPGGRSIDTDKVLNRYAGEISMIFLAQFLRLGLQRVGSHSVAKEQKDLFHLGMSALLDNIQETINRFLVAPLLELNGMPPWVEIVHDPIAQTSIDAMATFLGTLVKAGLITPDIELENMLRSMIDAPERIVPEPEDDETPEEAGARTEEETVVTEERLAKRLLTVQRYQLAISRAMAQEDATTAATLQAELKAHLLKSDSEGPLLAEWMAKDAGWAEAEGQMKAEDPEPWEEIGVEQSDIDRAEGRVRRAVTGIFREQQQEVLAGLDSLIAAVAGPPEARRAVILLGPDGQTISNSSGRGPDEPLRDFDVERDEATGLITRIRERAS